MKHVKRFNTYAQSLVFPSQAPVSAVSFQILENTKRMFQSCAIITAADKVMSTVKCMNINMESLVKTVCITVF